ncbi:flagellar basal-body rod protein FlgB [Endozoicomonas sp. (ex Bugula neritina AB1)]|nr:flagellar basal-body rod protein FlgB [Endozoicomonas sp. (ex Bugula neritina AB1)]
MSITFENALGVLPDTLQYRTERAEILAGNIANVDTPGYQVKDLDFNRMLGQQKAMLSMQKTDPRHLALPGSEGVQGVMVEKDIEQPSADGNSVDLAIEQAGFMQNRMEFETSFTFLNMKFQGLQRAIAGQ